MTAVTNPAATYMELPDRMPAQPLLHELTAHGVVVRDLPPAERKPIYRASVTGWVTAALADRIACQVLRERPAMVWGEDWWGDSAELMMA